MHCGNNFLFLLSRKNQRWVGQYSTAILFWTCSLFGNENSREFNNHGLNILNPLSNFMKIRDRVQYIAANINCTPYPIAIHFKIGVQHIADMISWTPSPCYSAVTKYYMTPIFNINSWFSSDNLITMVVEPILLLINKKRTSLIHWYFWKEMGVYTYWNRYYLIYISVL